MEEDIKEFYRNPKPAVQGEDYEYTEEGEEIELQSTDHAHYWVDQGIQITGERVIKCRDCPLGMERDPSIQVVDGKMLEPVN